MTKHFRIQAVLACSCVAVNSNAHSNMVGVTTTPTNYITFFTDYASNNARKKFTYYAGSSARILAASLDMAWSTIKAIKGIITKTALTSVKASL